MRVRLVNQCHDSFARPTQPHHTHGISTRRVVLGHIYIHHTTMTSQEDLQAGYEQMDYSIHDSGPIAIPVSKPAVYTNTTKPDRDLQRLETELESHGFGLMRVRTENNPSEFYCYFTVVTDHYKRMNVKVWEDKTRFYPNENHIDKYEFTRVVNAVETAFGVEFEHSDD